MCRVIALLVCGLCAAAPALRAQGAERADARHRLLLARAESLDARQREAQLAGEARERAARRARVVEWRGVAFVVPAAAPDSAVRELADSAFALLDEFGTVPRRFLTSLVVVWSSAEDTASALSGGRFVGRRRVPIGSPIVGSYESATRHRASVVPQMMASPAALGWMVATGALRSYSETLDAEWRAWLPAEYGLRRLTTSGEGRAWQTFAPGTSSEGRGCLSGKAASCRLWFGLDREENPYAVRYSPADLRAIYQNFSLVNNSLHGRACVAGSDPECVAFAREVGQPSPVPADGGSRRSLLRAVRDLHGAPALAAALADTSGSIGQRLARATGASEDSLVMEWRRRVLGQGGALQSRAGGKEAVPALLFAGLLLFAAAGSGRWR
jgi:hypothetical protein